MAAHESPRTTKLYDRTSDAIALDEVERIRFSSGTPSSSVTLRCAPWLGRCLLGTGKQARQSDRKAGFGSQCGETIWQQVNRPHCIGDISV
jgi:hypothetical protein